MGPNREERQGTKEINEDVILASLLLAELSGNSEFRMEEEGKDSEYIVSTHK